MADLGVVIVQRFGRLPIMPSAPSIVVNVGGGLGEQFRLADPVTNAVETLLALPANEAVHVVANTVSVISQLGRVAFNASPDDAIVTDYTARIRVSGNSTVVATQDLGKPTPDGNGVIIADLTTTFAGLAAGNYTVSILATAPGGSTDSAESAPFALPLS
jgi:hypothetical protein